MHWLHQRIGHMHALPVDKQPPRSDAKEREKVARHLFGDQYPRASMLEQGDERACADEADAAAGPRAVQATATSRLATGSVTRFIAGLRTRL